jgi:predicted ATPase
LRAAYAHGACVIDLASITDPQLMSGTVARALGLATLAPNPLPKLLEFLKHRQILIVLDSCEHLVEAAAALAEQLLSGAPNADVVATSRAPLRARSEWVLRLSPLELPPPAAALTAEGALARQR